MPEFPLFEHQQGDNNFTQFLHAYLTRLPINYLSKRVDHNRKGDGIDDIAQLSGIVSTTISGNQHRIIDTYTLQVIKNRLPVVYRHANKLQTLQTVLILQSDELRNFFQAGRAPGSPEVDDQQLSLPLSQGLRGCSGVGKTDFQRLDSLPDSD